MLDQDLKEQLRGYLERLVRPVEIAANLDDSEGSRELLALLDDIASTSERVHVRTGYEVSVRAPSFTVGSPGENISLRFAGLPLGHEFTSLVLALLQAGGYPPRVGAEIMERIKSLSGPLKFETYFSLSCQNCPD